MEIKHAQCDQLKRLKTKLRTFLKQLKIHLTTCEIQLKQYYEGRRSYFKKEKCFKKTYCVISNTQENRNK